MNDYNPKLNGNESVKKIRKFQKKSTSQDNKQSFIVITADEDKMVDQYVKKKLEEIAIKNGANEYIHKPIKYKTLKKVLDKFIKVRSSFV